MIVLGDTITNSCFVSSLPGCALFLALHFDVNKISLLSLIEHLEVLLFIYFYLFLFFVRTGHGKKMHVGCHHLMSPLFLSLG